MTSCAVLQCRAGLGSTDERTGLQIVFFRQLLKLRTSISPHVIFAELAEAEGSLQKPVIKGSRRQNLLYMYISSCPTLPHDNQGIA